LKILPEYFDAVWDGIKTFEIRKNDRNFQVGDEVILQEYDPEKGYTGSGLVVIITYITNYAQKDDYVVFGIKRK
jgi:predicted RNA-binding protein with PUA-like domain